MVFHISTKKKSKQKIAKFDEKREIAVKQNESEKMKGKEKYKNTMPPIQFMFF